MSTTANAINRQIAISPQLLEIIQDDPEALAKLHRVQRALLSDKATRLLLQMDTPNPTQVAAVIEALRKAEKDDLPMKNVANGGAGFHFSITLPGAGQSFEVKSERPAIEGEAEVVEG